MHSTISFNWSVPAVYPKKYAHGFRFAVLCCGYTLTDFPTSIRLTSLAPWQSNDCPSASKATLMNMDKYFMWIPYERLHNHNKAKHNKTVCIFLGIYCIVTIFCNSGYVLCPKHTCFLVSLNKLMNKKIKVPVIWDAMMTSCDAFGITGSLCGETCPFPSRRTSNAVLWYVLCR